MSTMTFNNSNRFSHLNRSRFASVILKESNVKYHFRNILQNIFIPVMSQCLESRVLTGRGSKQPWRWNEFGDVNVM